MRTTRNNFLVASATLLMTFLVFGCALGSGKATVSAGGSTAIAPSNASGPTKVAVAESATRVVVDAGTKVIGSLLSPGAVQTVEFPRMEVTQDVKTNTTEVSPPRAPDQSVALAKVAVADRRPLLYAAIFFLLVAIGVGSPGLLDHPTAGLAIGAGSAIFFLAWRAASEPWLSYAAGAMILGGVALAVGYEISLMHRRKASASSTTIIAVKPSAAQS